MKTFLLLILSSLIAFAVSGCNESHAATKAQVEATPASIYKTGHGLQLTPSGRAFIGLKTGEVANHAMPGVGEVTAVPVDALLRTVKGDFVYVANGEWFLRTPVVVGAIDRTHVEIKDGLYEGDAIVIQGVKGLSLAEIQALNGGIGCADGH